MKESHTALGRPRRWVIFAWAIPLTTYSPVAGTPSASHNTCTEAEGQKQEGGRDCRAREWPFLVSVCVCVLSSSHSNREWDIWVTHTLPSCCSGNLTALGQMEGGRERERKGGRREVEDEDKIFRRKCDRQPIWQEERETGETICCCRQDAIWVRNLDKIAWKS